MTVARTGRIVVGVSDSPSGRAALLSAVSSAQERRGSLELVRVWRDVGRLFSLSLHEASMLSESQLRDQQLLDDAAAAVALMAPEVPCTQRLTRGELYDDLLAVCQGAELLVLGAGNPQGSSHLVGEWFVKHAPCSVRVVHEEHADASTG